MTQWCNSESLISRKYKKKDNCEDLLVFGYACKIFRDDEKALHIDQGKHLIPWNADTNLKIDRYDCRGHLSDISKYEGSREGYDALRWLGLDENERRLEKRCDDERYYSLHFNEDEVEMYNEEKQKRNQANEFQYSYDVPMKSAIEEDSPTLLDKEVDDKYLPPPDLDVPMDITIPKTMKESARIEKTAMFVSTQGPQMEILIKAKQSDNPQFSFLNQNDPLYKFYRHVLDAIKTGRYRIKEAKEDQAEPNTVSEDTGDHYLHPSLASSCTTSTDILQPTIRSIPHSFSVNCAYSQLVNRIQGTTNVPENDSPAHGPSVESIGELDACPKQALVQTGNVTCEQQQQYYQYYMQQQYYEYYKHLMQSSGIADESSTHSEIPLGLNMQTYIQQMIYNQYLNSTQTQQSITNPFAQIVSTINKEIVQPFPPNQHDISGEPVIYGDSEQLISQAACTKSTEIETSSTVTSNLKDVEDKVSTNSTTDVPSPKKQTLLSLMEVYGSDTEEDSTDDENITENYKVPDAETKIVIDKMASYVVKNGADFENIVKSRADPRFEFLNANHEFHRYYQSRVDEEHKKIKEFRNENNLVAGKDQSKTCASKTKEKRVLAPVSFSIKKSREDHPKDIKSALPVDDETDEEDVNDEKGANHLPPIYNQPPTLVSSNTSRIIHRMDSVSTTSVGKPVKVVDEEMKSEIEKNNKQAEKNDVVKEEPGCIIDFESTSKEKPRDDIEPKTITTYERNGIGKDDSDPVLEMIDLTTDLCDEKTVNDEKNKDIFDLVSEKEKIQKKNRELQLERRRKAMAFLKLKSANSSTPCETTTGTTTIPTIDLSHIESPGKKNSSDKLDSQDENSKIRERSRTKDKEVSKEARSERLVETEKTVSLKEKGKKRKMGSPNPNAMDESEEGKTIDEDNTKHRKSHKKKSHKR